MVLTKMYRGKKTDRETDILEKMQMQVKTARDMDTNPFNSTQEMRNRDTDTHDIILTRLDLRTGMEREGDRKCDEVN